MRSCLASFSRGISAFSVAVLFFFDASRAHARPLTAEERADAFFEEGRALLAQGKLLEACTKLEESETLVPSGRTVLNLADCYEQRGLVASAHAKFLEAAARARAVRRSDAERHAMERAAKIEKRVPHVTIHVAPEDAAPGLVVTADGAPLPRSALIALPIDPGRHVLAAHDDRGRRWSETIEPREGDTLRVELRWPKDREGGLPPAALAPVARESQDRSRAPAYTALAIGVIGVGIGSFAGIQVLSAKETVDTHCQNKRCDEEGLDAASSGRTYSVVSPIAFVAGALGLGTGIYLLASERSSRSVGFDGRRLFLQGSF
jgi:hypothetical protein